MSLLRQYRWFAVASALTLAYTAMSLVVRSSMGLTVVGDTVGVIIMLLAGAVMLANAVTRPASERMFWGLMVLAFSLWAINQWGWAYYDVVLRLPIPDPYYADIILFFHVVPMIAAVAWRPDHTRSESRLHLSTLNFMMLLVWWVFLYAFIVFPHQYVVLNIDIYNQYYDLLYVVENILLLVVLAYASSTSTGGWKRLYLNLLGGCGLYTIGSQILDREVAKGSYYSGSLFDAPLVGAVLWIAASALTCREWKLENAPPPPDGKWKVILPQLAMLALLSLPVLGLWTFLADTSPEPSRFFRLSTVLAAMLVLGAFVFLRQYIQDQELMHLLGESRAGFENQQRLQSHLVQKEKLASLGQLVAGAAHEINHPLTSIMDQSEELWSGERLSGEQDALVRKIVNQARRTRDLVSDLLSFAQRAPGEKALVDLGLLLHRGAQMLEPAHAGGRVKVEVFVESEFPRVLGNANQLFQIIVEIIENSMDALHEVGGGSLHITAQRLDGEAVLQFSDTGPGMREPQRVFDPFYTTKPIGRGTGLGLSAVYGMVQDHGGQISCQNKSEGGALFMVRFPAATEMVAEAAVAAKA